MDDNEKALRSQIMLLRAQNLALTIAAGEALRLFALASPADKNTSIVAARLAIDRVVAETEFKGANQESRAFVQAKMDQAVGVAELYARNHLGLTAKAPVLQ